MVWGEGEVGVKDMGLEKGEGGDSGGEGGRG